MKNAMLILGCMVMLLAGWASAAPYTPTDPAQILEHLPYRPNDPVARELKNLRLQLASDPGKRYCKFRVYTATPATNAHC